MAVTRDVTKLCLLIEITIEKDENKQGTRTESVFVPQFDQKIYLCSNSSRATCSIYSFQSHLSTSCITSATVFIWNVAMAPVVLVFVVIKILGNVNRAKGPYSVSIEIDVH